MFGSKLSSAAREARRRWRGHRDPIIASWARWFDRLDLAPELKSQIWSAAGLALAFADLLADAADQSGRAIQEQVFLLHHLLKASPPDPQSIPDRIRPFQSWIAEPAPSREARRRLCLQWIDILVERLTMPRYPSKSRRAAHAHILLGNPLRLIASDQKSHIGDSDMEIWLRLADQILAYWDLAHAAAHTARGWNRIELPQAEQLGGFFGLGEEARPPAPDTIRRAAEDLRAAHATDTPTPPAPWPALYAALATELRARINLFIKS